MNDRSRAIAPRMGSRIGAFAALLCGIATTAMAQQPLRYTVRVDPADLAHVQVELRIPDAPRELALATYAHPIFDSDPWKRIEGLSVQSAGAAATVVRADSALWKVSVAGPTATVRYTVRIPDPPTTGKRRAWELSLTRNGGLLGGRDMFLYLEGAADRPAIVSLELPDGWRTASGLPLGDAPRTFVAADTRTLLDSPVLVGKFLSWTFAVSSATHRIVYLPFDGAVPFDTAAFTGAIERVADQAATMFQGVPYRSYVFMFVDSAGSGMSHRNSMEIGAPSAALAANPYAVMPNITHEFFHSWNLFGMYPKDYWSLGHTQPAPTKSLWFTEGFTMYYGDVLRRRAGLPTEDATRAAHIERIIGQYLSTPDNARFSAQAVSAAATVRGSDPLGSVNVSHVVQGELFGILLDLLIRDQTNGVRSLDDLMRDMMTAHRGEPGFTPEQLQAQAARTCACDVRLLFESYITGARPMDFNRYFALAGLRVKVTRTKVEGAEVAKAALEEIVNADGREKQLRALFLRP
jgi:predicted metalloprotease with PDZ domain